ncbi:hypothetical protein M3J09_008102 [Ascochyta lentis]
MSFDGSSVFFGSKGGSASSKPRVSRTFGKDRVCMVVLLGGVSCLHAWLALSTSISYLMKCGWGRDVMAAASTRSDR